MARRACDGNGLLDAFRAAVANLEAHVDEINGLNVYPVPDGDTGSNMYATVKAALDEAEAVAGEPADRIAAAISFGSLMGARGNSGVITSQIFRGMADGLGGKRRFNGLDLAHALSEGARTAYSAVAKPVEGTILTVIRESAAAAVEAAEHDNDIESVLGATLAGAERSVAKTPTLLAILREAGVVDAGGQGLYRLFQGALLHLLGQAPVTTGGRRAAAGAKPSTLVAHADEGFGYETMFLLQAVDRKPLDLDAIRDHLETIGESVLVAGDARALKVHVHNERPDQVIAFGLGLGSLSRISVENLDNQARDVRETRAAAFTATEAPG
ncbi:MAG TPA: DAK2 domain-containing protein, partial [Methylomirabilota bacterium]|nr:DAK2 domain-containing protein [Methylomirabilota bacterium]